MFLCANEPDASHPSKPNALLQNQTCRNLGIAVPVHGEQDSKLDSTCEITTAAKNNSIK